MYTYEHPRPMVTTDIVVLRAGETGPEVLLIQRGNPPFQGAWALPGGFVDKDEDLAAAAERELREETGLSGLPLNQLCTVGTPGRDPRGHTISVIYVVACPVQKSDTVAGDDAAATAWFPVDALPEMAFDHRDIMAQVRLHAVEDEHDESE